MAISLKRDYESFNEAHQVEVRDMILAGLKQIQEGKTKDFDEVCDRLEKKYEGATV